jgi:hypothetical protein
MPQAVSEMPCTPDDHIAVIDHVVRRRADVEVEPPVGVVVVFARARIVRRGEAKAWADRFIHMEPPLAAFPTLML